MLFVCSGYFWHKASSFMMSLPTVSFAWAEGAGQGEVGGCTQRTMSGLGFRNTRSTLSGIFLPFYVCINGLRKQSPYLRAHIFSSEVFFPVWISSSQPRADYCKLVNGWVWLESQMCRGWLREHLVKLECWKPNSSSDVVSLMLA